MHTEASAVQLGGEVCSRLGVLSLTFHKEGWWSMKSEVFYPNFSFTGGGLVINSTFWLSQSLSLAGTNPPTTQPATCRI